MTCELATASFDKSKTVFPVKENCIYLGHCGVSPLYSGAAAELQRFTDGRLHAGAGVFQEFGQVLPRLHQALGALLKSAPENISFMKNTAEAMSVLANGYPFREGDEVISYVHEYPSNHYPWLLQQRRGVKLVLLPDCDPVGEFPADRPRGWSLDQLANLVTDRTRVVAISHVQFTSGFAADLAALGRFCAERNIDLVVDAAQSLGALPVYPEQFGISALAASGWKWLLGPLGCGVLYTAPAVRAKIDLTMAGADVVAQGENYLDHTWQPHTDGRRFEYSTVQVSYAAALTRSLADLFLTYAPEQIRAEIFRLQDLFLARLDRTRFRPVLFPARNRSGILALAPAEDAVTLAKRLAGKGIIATARGGYLRIAPHFYNDDAEMCRAGDVMNTL